LRPSARHQQRRMRAAIALQAAPCRRRERASGCPGGASPEQELRARSSREMLPR
jgi:hypothetical protein